MWFHYSQNNSGGRFDFNKKLGISHHVLIEADSPVNADRRAENIGLYFDGYGDCPCCGDRWHRAWEEGTKTPMVYSKKVNPNDKIPKEKFGNSFWMVQEGVEGFMHFKDGTFKPFWIHKNIKE